MEIQKSEALQLYRKLLLTRFAEAAIGDEYFHDEIKTPVHLGIGAEAITVGVHHALPSSTRYFGTYRNHALFLTLSEDTDSFFGELYGKVTGCAKGKAGSMHLTHPEHNLILTSAVVGTTIPVAVGAAMAMKYQNQTEALVAVFFGDGAVEEGVFWESLNFAALHRLPILFVCEDNDLAIHTFKNQRQGFTSLEGLCQSLSIPYVSGSGIPLVEVLEKTKSCLEQMKGKGMPGFLNFTYFRHLQHVGPLPDFDANYRPQPVDLSTNLDPVFMFEERLEKWGVNRQHREEIRIEVMTKIKNSIAKAKQAPFPDAAELLKNVFAPSEPIVWN